MYVFGVGPPAALSVHSILPVRPSVFVGVFPNAAVARPGCCATVKFYSARDAHRAQKACHEKHLFQNSPVKVGPSRKFLTPLVQSAEFCDNRLAFTEHS